MNRLLTLLLFVLAVCLVVAGYWGLTHDTWYRDLYCLGKIDNLDPFCP